MAISWEQYCAGEEMAAMGRELKRITDAVTKRNEGRNLSCFPVLSFGWKDADLDPEGCTGIKEMTWKDDDTLLVTVGGHKTFGYDGGPKRRERQWLAYCDYCTGYSCDGDEDGFTASFEGTFEVPVVVSAKTLKMNMKKTVENVIEAARKACEAFERDMAAASKATEKL